MAKTNKIKKCCNSGVPCAVLGESPSIKPIYFKEKRLEIIRVLVEEFTILDDSKKVTTDEMLRLVDRLYSVLTPIKVGNIGKKKK